MDSAYAYECCRMPIIKQHPSGRVGTPDDIADLSFLVLLLKTILLMDRM